MSDVDWKAIAKTLYDALEGMWCDNCSGRKCMDCVFRHMHDRCENDCPTCCRTYGEDTHRTVERHKARETAMQAFWDAGGVICGHCHQPIHDQWDVATIHGVPYHHPDDEAEQNCFDLADRTTA